MVLGWSASPPARDIHRPGSHAVEPARRVRACTRTPVAPYERFQVLVVVPLVAVTTSGSSTSWPRCDSTWSAPHEPPVTRVRDCATFFWASASDAHSHTAVTVPSGATASAGSLACVPRRERLTIGPHVVEPAGRVRPWMSPGVGRVGFSSVASTARSHTAVTSPAADATTTASFDCAPARDSACTGPHAPRGERVRDWMMNERPSRVGRSHTTVMVPSPAMAIDGSMASVPPADRFTVGPKRFAPLGRMRAWMRLSSARPCAHTTTTAPSGAMATRFSVASPAGFESVRTAPNRLDPGPAMRTCSVRFQRRMFFQATAVRPSDPMAMRGSSWLAPRAERLTTGVNPPRGPRRRVRICHVRPSQPSQA